MTTRRELILDTAADLAIDFLNHARKQDEELPRGEIEAAIKAKEVTIDEILAPLREALEEASQ